MPTGCRTKDKQVPLKYTEGRTVMLPWCTYHGRWYAECQGHGAALSFLFAPPAQPVPAGVIDLSAERAKRNKRG